MNNPLVDNKSAFQKNYYLKLKRNVEDFLFSFKKRYDLFPWTEIAKIDINSLNKIDYSISYEENEYTVPEAVRLINSKKVSLKNKMKLSAFNNIFKDFINSTKGKMSIEVKEIYENYNKILKEEFNSMKNDLNFCVHSLKELNKVLKEYNTNIEEYVNMINYDEDVYNEAAFIEYEDIYYNRIPFEQGDINICFITGYSGGGKSTMSKNENKMFREVVDLDRIVLFMHKDMKYFKKLGKFYYEFAKGPGRKYIMDDYTDSVVRNASSSFRRQISRELVDFAKKYAARNRRKRLVLEGVWIYRYIEPSYIDDCAVYIKGTSLATSTHRAIKRDIADPEDIKKGDKNDFHNNGKKKSFLFKTGYSIMKTAMATSDALSGTLTKYQKYFGKKYKQQIGQHQNYGRRAVNAVKNITSDSGNSFKEIRSNVQKNVYNGAINIGKKTKKFFSKESEEYDIMNNLLFSNIYEDASLEEFDSMVIEAYDELFINDDEELEYTEGTNNDYREMSVTAKKEFKRATKEYKKLMKEQKFVEARKCLADAREVLDKYKKAVENLDDTLIQGYIGSFISTLLVLTRLLVVMVSAFMLPVIITLGVEVAALVKSVKEGQEYLQGFNTLDKDIMNSKEIEDTTAKRNPYKVLIIGRIADMQRKLKILDQKTTNLIAKKNRSEKLLRMESVLNEEAIEYNNIKLSIYEACQNGEISLAEREELLSNLRDERVLIESTVDIETSDEYFSNDEKFEKVKIALYEKCANGELSVDERENLINIAYDRIFGEATEQNQPTKATQIAAKVQDKVMDAAANVAAKGVENAVKTVANNSANKDE